MKDSKNLVIGLLCAVVCVMAVAYAAFSTNLEINTTANINSSWNVSITSVSCSTTPVAGGLTGQSAGLVDGSLNGTSAEFEMALVQPGDSAYCNITVTNGGNIAAKLASLVPTSSGDAPITFTVDPAQEQIAGRAVLAASGSETIRVTAVYNNVEAGQGSAFGQTKNIKLDLTYNQYMGG